MGVHHPKTLTALHNLACTYSVLGDYNKALELQNVVYNEMKGILGANHPDTLTVLYNLACLYSVLGDCDKAIELENIVYNERKKF